MLIGTLIRLFEVLRLVDELLPQPLRRGIQIGGLMAKPVCTELLAVPVRPVITRDGRVVGFEIPELRPAAHRGLQDGADLRPACKLVFLLEVRHGDIAERHLDGLDFHRVVGAAEHDFLTGRPVDQLHRGHLRLPVRRHAQRTDRPDVLRVNAVADGVRHLAQHQRMRARMLHQQQRNHD